MRSDDLLLAVAVVELVQRQGGNTIAIDDGLHLLSGESCGHARALLYAAGVICHLSELTGFDLGSFVAQERADALGEHQDPPGMA